MTPKRLFLAIKVPEQMKDSFLRFQMSNAHLEKLNIRWTKSDNFHVTLLFLGNVYPHNVVPMGQALQNILDEVRPFKISFEQYLVRSPHEPRMIWGQFRDCEEFSQLSLKSFHGLRKFMSERFPAKHQIPHVTMARLRDVRHAFEIKNSAVNPTDFLVEEIELWESQRLPDGAKYTCLAQFPLKA